MTATADVVLRIGSQLSGSGLKDLQAGYQMISGLVNKFVNFTAELDRTNEALDSTKVKIGGAIEASKGLIRAVDLVTAGNKLWESGIKVTSTELAALAKKAVIYGDAVGISASDAMDNLTGALIKGTSRGLKPFGIELDTTKTRGEAFSEAVKKINNELRDTEVTLNTANDKIDSYKNGLFNVATVAWGAMSSFFVGLATGTEDGAANFSQFTAIMIDDLTVIKNEAAALGGMFNEFFAGLRDGEGLFASFRSAAISAGADMASKDPEVIAARAAAEAAQADLLDYATQTGAYDPNYAGPQSVAAAATGNLDQFAAKPAPRRGGGGSRLAPRARDTRTVDEMFAPLMRDEITDEDLMSGMRGGALSGADQASADMMNEYAAAVDAATAAESSRLDVALQLAQVRGDEEAIKSAEMERIDFDREQAQARYEEGEITLEQLTLELELLQAKSNEIERQGTLAQQWSDAWEAAYGKTRPAQFAMNSLVTSYTNVVGSAIRAAVTYGASVKQALLEALAATASQIAVESGLKAILEMAEGLAATGRREYDSASSHFASAAMYGVLAAAAGAASYAASAGAARGAAKGAKGAQVAGGGYETPLTNGRQAREEDRTINVTLNLDGEVVYNSIQKTDRRRVVSGESRIGG